MYISLKNNACNYTIENTYFKICCWKCITNDNTSIKRFKVHNCGRTNSCQIYVWDALWILMSIPTKCILFLNLTATAECHGLIADRAKPSWVMKIFMHPLVIFWLLEYYIVSLYVHLLRFCVGKSIEEILLI